MSAIGSSTLYSFGVFLDPMSRDMGWTRGDLSVAYALAFLTGAVGSFGTGWLTDRLGGRPTLILSSVLLASGLLLTAGISDLWQFYLYYGVLFGASSASYVVVLHTAIGLWFKQKLGLAMGIVTMSLGVGPLFFAPLGSYLVATSGWRTTFLMMGIVGGIVLLVCSWFVASKPSELGMSALGEETPTSAPATAPQVRPAIFFREDKPDFFRYAIATQPFVPLLLIHFFGCAGHSLPLAHIVAMASDAGITAILASTVLGTVMAVSTAMRLGSGVLTDRLGGKAVLILVLLLQCAAMLILVFANNVWLFYLSAVFLGLGYGGELVVFPIINRQYYGMAPVGAIYGVQMTAASLGMALGGYVGGFLFDLLGTYTGATLVAGFMSLLGVVTAFRLVSPFAKPAMEGVPA